MVGFEKKNGGVVMDSLLYSSLSKSFLYLHELSL